MANYRPKAVTVSRLTEADRNGPEWTETDLNGYQNGLSDYRNGPERIERDFCEYRNGLWGYKTVLLGVKIDRNTFNIDTNFIYLFLFKFF